MAERNSKDIADALAAMAAGQHDQEAEEAGAAPPAAGSPPPTPRQPAPARAPSPPGARPAAPAIPAAPAGADETRQPPTPAAPGSGDNELSSRFADAVLNMPAVDPALADQAADDQAVIAPPPPPEVFRARGHKRKDILPGRRTMIPLLLTLGVLLVTIAVLALSSGQDSQLGEFIPTKLAFGLLAGGVILLGLAAMNMAYVKKAMKIASQGD